ncbi:MAG: EthD domain-containing protein [bacterium]|nr:EthD domain-containing protein [bacterium]
MEEKWLRCVRRSRDPHDPEAAVDKLAASDARARVIDVVGSDQDLLALHGMPPQLPVRYELLSWEWGDSTPSFSSKEVEFGYRVSQREVFDELPARDAQGWRPGVKQLSFLRRPPHVSRDEFRELYFHHTAKLRDDQPGIAKYVQNVIEESWGDAPDLDGVSEIWFASLEDFRERYWSGPGVAERESKETGLFLDFQRTWSLIVRERVLAD